MIKNSLQAHQEFKRKAGALGLCTGSSWFNDGPGRSFWVEVGPVSQAAVDGHCFAGPGNRVPVQASINDRMIPLATIVRAVTMILLDRMMPLATIVRALTMVLLDQMIHLALLIQIQRH
jgi:hypothetical protein